ncbi:MAG: hypothetical protein E6R07_10575 [Nevskiaceae bacterium]|nr:MAG: hypothetical protein E6R07_10575 [Nevskiaceae bacterium]
MSTPDRNIDSPADAVLRVDALPANALGALLAPYGLRIEHVAVGADIPGSYWGEREAGLIGDTLYLRADTPVHSALHEAGHWLCMDAARRASVHTDARGDDAEEVGVCVLQALLAAQLPGYSQARLFADMDAWGYNFVLGSAQAWFEGDADDGRDWLRRHGLVDTRGQLSGQRRDA